MKTQHILIVGGVGLLLALAMAKKARAAQPQPGQPGYVASRGTNYATPTQTAGIVAGAVNGILNWVSGTPDSNRTDRVPGVIPDVGGAVDDLSGLWERATSGLYDVWGSSGDLGSADFGRVPSLGGFSLNDYWGNSSITLE